MGYKCENSHSPYIGYSVHLLTEETGSGDLGEVEKFVTIYFFYKKRDGPNIFTHHHIITNGQYILIPHKRPPTFKRYVSNNTGKHYITFLFTYVQLDFSQ